MAGSAKSSGSFCQLVRQPTREFGSSGKSGGGDLYVTVHVTD
ncbi:hypothetical protein [Streptomyces kronopolitis]